MARKCHDRNDIKARYFYGYSGSEQQQQQNIHGISTKKKKCMEHEEKGGAEGMGMIIHDDYYEAANQLTKRQRAEFFTACIDYFFTGEEPEIKGPVKACFITVRKRINLSRTRSEAGSKGGSQTQENEKQTASKTQANEKQTQIKTQVCFSRVEDEGMSNELMSKEIDREISSDTEAWVSFAQAAISRFESITGQTYRVPSPEVMRYLHAIYNAGHTLEDIEYVVISKLSEWEDDPKMSKYIRPSTLFGSKFEEYLNTAKTSKEAKVHADAAQYADSI